MKILYSCIILFLLIVNSLFAQVDDIKKGSDTNKEKGSTTTTNPESKGGDGCMSDACGLACNSGCFSSILQYSIIGLIKLQGIQLEKKAEIPQVISFDFMTHFGYAEPSSSLLLPRIRGNWGLFSSDLRFSNLVEYSNGSTDFYNTLDWQALLLNIVITKPVTARIGTGIMREYYSATTFIEHSVGADVNWKDSQYLASLEARIAKDYSTGATPRSEVNMRFNYRIIKGTHINGYAMCGGIYQNYYASVDVWTIQTGLTLSFH